MSISRKFAVVGLTLLVGSISTAALAVSKRTETEARSEVTRLLRLMDRDMNGSVSRDEFLQFMGAMFDRFDVNRSSQLEGRELSHISFGVSGRTVAEGRSDATRLLRLMDRDMNSAVSKDEFLRFMGQTFDRLDTNRNGQLEQKELYPLVGTNWDRLNDPLEHPF